MEHTIQNSENTLESVWAAFRETDRQMQETDRRMQETDRKFSDEK